MYVVNIVLLRGRIACHWLACIVVFLSFSPTRTNHKHTLYQIATEAVVHQLWKYKLFKLNIFPKVHSHLIAVPKADRGITGRCMENLSNLLILQIDSGRPAHLLFKFS